MGSKVNLTIKLAVSLFLVGFVAPAAAGKIILFMQAPIVFGQTTGLNNLEILTQGYPRSFLFWAKTRGLIQKGLTDTELEKAFQYFQGVMSPSEYFSHFIRYKQAHPEKLVFLFTQGYVFSEKQTQFDPIDRSKFFAGHWVYFQGCKISQYVPAEFGETEIHVESPYLFKLAKAFNKKICPDDIGLCLLDTDGKPNWNHSEQVQLISVDPARKTIRVKRGCFSTKPMAFPANHSWAAAHASQPWGYQGGVSWVANYSPLCPKDAQGRTAADILLDEFSTLLLPGGQLENYDGLEFDVLHFRPEHAIGNRGRTVDTDGDGKGDGGYHHGVNKFGIGVYHFAELLRKKLGSNRLMMGDCSPSAYHQRCYSVLNGIESEWWPQWGDNDITYWSSGLNVHFFWKENSQKPYFSYINHKVAGHDYRKFLNTPFNIHRLVLAAAQFVDAAITSFFTPKPEPGETVGIWDEICMGTGRKIGWLGQPLAPPIRIAMQTKDVLNGEGKTMSSSFVQRFKSSSASFQVKGKALRVTLKNSKVERFFFSLCNIPCQGPDLFVRFKIKAEALPEYPEQVPRQVKVIPLPAEKPVLVTFANTRWFEATFYYRGIPREKVDLKFEVEGGRPLWLSDISVHTHADAIYREFEKGIVLANPGDHPYTFHLNQISPQKRYRRLQGSSRQDPKTNDGSNVGDTVTLGPRDGLFLVLR